MDSQDVCLRLNISPRTLQTLRDNGKLPYSQIQHKIFYKPEDVEALLTFVGLQRKEKNLTSKKYKSIGHGRYYNERQQTGCCFFQGIGEYACENEQDRR